MSAPPRRLARWLLGAMLVIGLGFSGACLAKNTGVDEDPLLQTGPCYQTLVDRNVAQPTTAPNRELGAACAAEHDDVERAWARVIRLWGSDSTDVPDYDSYVRSDSGAAAGPAWGVAAIVGMLLIYAVCGTPVRPVARMLSGEGATIETGGEAVAIMVLRGLFCVALLWLLGFSYAPAIAAVAFAVLLARNLPASSASRSAGETPAEKGGFAVFAAETINDLHGAAPGVLGLALLAGHDARLAATGVALALVASIPAVIHARRKLRSRPIATTASGALLAALIGAILLLDPSFAWLAVGGAMGRLAAALTLAAAVGAWGWRNARSHAV